jgi:hypothetical protein
VSSSTHSLGATDSTTHMTRSCVGNTEMISSTIAGVACHRGFARQRRSCSTLVPFAPPVWQAHRASEN